MRPDPRAGEPPAFLPGRLLESCEDDVDLAREVITDFLASAPAVLSRLAAAVAAGDAAQVRLEAHSLKGASRTIGAEALAATGARLEAAGRDGGLAEAPPLLAEAERQFAALQNPLSLFLGGEQ